MTEPSREEASAALAELAAEERAVREAERRTLPILLVGWSALVVFDYAAKDHLRGGGARAAISALCGGASLLLGTVESAAKPVQPFQVGTPWDRLAARRLGAALLGWAVAERILIVGLRRSAVRYPNTLVGLALAVGRPAGYLGLRRMFTADRAHG